MFVHQLGYREGFWAMGAVSLASLAIALCIRYKRPTQTDKRASAFGTYHAAVGFALLPASLIAGLLWERVGPQAQRLGRRGPGAHQERDAERAQPPGHHLDTIALLVPQFLGAAQYGAAVGAGGGDEHRGEFVDGERHRCGRDLDPAQARAAHDQVGHRLAADEAWGTLRDIGPHGLHDVENAGAGRVHADRGHDEFTAGGNRGADDEEGGHDDLYEKAVELVRETGQASASFLQRRFSVGYNRASRLIEQMEMRGVVGPANGAKPREVFMR